MSPEGTTSYRILAKNTASESDNKIHEDETARRLGFTGGLVPGTTLFTHMCRPPIERFGSAWLASGTAECRFLHPIYEGEEILMESREAGSGEGVGLELTVRNSAGQVCATGRAAIPVAPIQPPDLSAFPAAAMPIPAPAPTAEVLARADVLGSIEARFDVAAVDQYLAFIGEPTPMDNGRPVAHPGWLLTFANLVVMSNFNLGPWIHTSSGLELCGMVRDGEPVSIRSRLVRAVEVKGNRMIEVDVAAFVDGRAAMKARHQAIIEPRALRS